MTLCWWPARTQTKFPALALLHRQLQWARLAQAAPADPVWICRGGYGQGRVDRPGFGGRSRVIQQATGHLYWAIQADNYAWAWSSVRGYRLANGAAPPALRSGDSGLGWQHASTA
jgi:hypothetical protein